MSTKPTLVVLAAGMGSRYGGLKQVDPVGPSGEAILDYSVFDAVRAGFAKVVFVIRRDFEEEFRAKIGKKFERMVEVGYCYQDIADLPAPYSVPAGRVKPWGTAHATRAARDAVKGPFALVNADDFYGRDAFERLARFLVGSDRVEIGSNRVEIGSDRVEDSNQTLNDPMLTLSDPIVRHMTRSPLFVYDDAYAAELLKIFEKKRIDDLPVCDRSGRVVGLVDIQDLPKMKVL